MSAEDRADFLNDLQEFVEKYGLNVGGYDDQDEEYGTITVEFIR